MPLLAATVVPTFSPSRYTQTVLPAGAVPLSVGRVSLVMPSLPELPLSREMPVISGAATSAGCRLAVTAS